ncbi:hypothetical protein SAMN04487895_10934 [Paenibacillus sophorae]|uniref:Uncharacterized protein n=1 Tax=Paenibacillus sophorae TaxID=1333845 RepID=A0A1H8QWH6_9BACL|nr:hypothetical protein [Paenibacillus sophorae]QWU14861.1 hypothetical protein KP014_23545 [Paenibacillus sophorae]SEO58552.1 hypothetical protein SAMN04487895_10934 [Paenibacillus sophorae]
MKRSERIKIKSKVFEVLFLIISIITMFLFLYLQIIHKANLSEFIKDFVQVNITSTLSIAALVASMGAFRWDHYRKALIHEGLDEFDRKRFIYSNAKLPLYRVIKLNSIFIIINLITLQAGTITVNKISLYYVTIDWKWIIIALILTCLILGLTLIYSSMKYMKDLIFK